MSDEQQIRDLIQRWATAVHAGDLPAVLADHASDIVMFDVPPPSRASAASTPTATPGRAFFDGRPPARYSRSNRWRSPPARTSHSPSPCCAAARRQTSIVTPTSGCGSPSACEDRRQGPGPLDSHTRTPLLHRRH